VIGNARVADAFSKGVHGTTFGGNPVACAAGLALIEELEEKSLMLHATELGAAFKAELLTLSHKHIQIRAVRQYGLMIGISTSRDASYYVPKLLEKGIIINATNTNVIRLLPPLTLTLSEMRRCTEALDEVFGAEWRLG
jgi:acetylornithine aminotransferase